MTEILRGSVYSRISGKIARDIDINRLPLYGEFEFSKLSAESYGKVKISLSIETDTDTLNQIRSFTESANPLSINYFTYLWAADENLLPRSFEKFIKPEIVKFIELISVFRETSKPILRFTVLDGRYKENERPGHKYAVQNALIKLFEQI